MSMLQIRILIERPVLTLMLLAAGVMFVMSVSGGDAPVNADATGGAAERDTVVSAEETAKRERQLQSMLDNREEILRYEVQQLEARYLAAKGSVSPELLAQYRRAVTELVGLLQDRRRSEEALKESLLQIWDAQGRALAVDAGGGAIGRLAWPVDPALGISARFHEASYEETFGIPHEGVDIPAEQGTTVRAAADGVVEEIRDNGLGFNALLLRHDGFVTLYGHVQAFLVQEGQTVRAGDPVALSGGMPGTPGAGHLTTGPHLHFEVITGGEHVDPLPYLPPLQ